LFFGVKRKRKAPVIAGTWTFAQKGDASGSVVENSATSLSISARGTTDNGPDIDYAYQPVASGDIQIVARIPDKAEWSGHNETFTNFGVGITEGSSAEDWYAHALTFLNADGTRLKYGTGGTTPTAHSGQTGQSYPRYLALTYDASETEIRAWESANASDWFQIGETIIRDLSYPARAYVFGCSHDPFETTTATLTACVLSSTIDISEATPPDPEPRKVAFTGDFESEQVNVSTSNVDGFRIRTARHPQPPTDFVQINNGGACPSAEIDTKVVASEVPPSTSLGSSAEVFPRVGSNFLRTAIYKTKDYTEWAPNPEDRPRLNASLVDHPFDFDVEMYIGFSIYLPSNLEIESGSGNRQNALYIVNTTPSATLWILNLSLSQTGTQNWAFRWWTDDSSVNESTGAENQVSLGEISPDRGKWTDFVIRYRLNPFTETTNASTISGGKNQSYDGNKGILQVWKSEGEVDGNGDRTMVLTSANIVDAPVGLVPKATAQPYHQFRQYKPQWKTTSGTVAGPSWIGFDAIFFGDVLVDGTTFSDVHAGRLSAP
jgi:hypothetical protein